MTIDFANLQKQYQLYKDEIDSAMQAVLNKSNYIMGEEVQELRACRSREERSTAERQQCVPPSGGLLEDRVADLNDQYEAE